MNAWLRRWWAEQQAEQSSDINEVEGCAIAWLSAIWLTLALIWPWLLAGELLRRRKR